MLHFIPAWYRKNGWSENEQYWYVRRQHTEFDDTVKQIQLFHRKNVYPYQITLLSFTPNFRHFLHRQGVYHAPYWSCFDAIQEVRRKKAMLLSFHNLKWPAGIEFIYSDFAVIAMLENERYAQVEFGEDGNPIQVDMYKNGIIHRRNIYDDRGFVSSTVIYREGKPYYQDYLTEKGIWKMRCFQEDGHVEINPKHPTYLLNYKEREISCVFLKEKYDAIEQVLYEVFQKYVQLTDAEDLFCIAMHSQHIKLLERVLSGRKIILSVYGERFLDMELLQEEKIYTNVKYVICDTEDNIQKIKMYCPQMENIVEITPYDARQDNGISQQLKVQKILFPVDGIEAAAFHGAIRAFGQYLRENDNAEVYLFTRQSSYDYPAKILEMTRKYLKASGFQEELAAENEANVMMNKIIENKLEDDLEESRKISPRFFVEQCVDELAVSRCMREQRVIVDFRTKTDLYLQVNAISFGIPQIVLKGSNFVNHKKNGIVLKGIKELPGALDFYLRGLANWNHASQEAYEISKKYSTNVLIKRWKEVIETVERNKSITDWKKELESDI